MNHLLVAVLNNPQLLKFQEYFELSGIAFVVQCSNIAAIALLQRNPSLTLSGFTELDPDEDAIEADRETPCVDSSPTAWLFPKWKAQKALYIFGTLASQCDVVLPRGKLISRKHFAVYLSHNGVWIVRNLSRYGTWVNNELLELPGTGEIATQTAFNPDSPNNIRVGNFEFSIHPVLHTPLAAHDDNTVSMLLELKTKSEGTQTTSATKVPIIYRPSYIQKAAYHYLRERPIPVQSQSEVCTAIRKNTGQYCIAKLYRAKDLDKAFGQFEMMLDFKDERNIAFYDEFVRPEASCRIMTPYLDAVPLRDYLGLQGQIYNIEMAARIYKQIAGALACLKDHRILHNDVNENTILVEICDGRYTSYLTRFSEFTVADSNINEGYHRDLSSLTSTVEKMLPSFGGLPCCDPELRSLMLQAHEGRISVEVLGSSLDVIAHNFERAPFQTSTVIKEITIHRIVDSNGAEAIQLLEFLRMILHHNPRYTKDMELTIRQFIRKERLFQLDSKTYCHLNDAEKLLHILRDKHALFIDLTPPKHKEACWYETKHIVNAQVSYHEPTGLVNITQILNLFNTENA